MPNALRRFSPYSPGEHRTFRLLETTRFQPHLTPADASDKTGARHLRRKRLKQDGREGKETGEPARKRRNTTEAFVPVSVATAAFAEVEFPNGVRVRVPATNAEALRVAIRVGDDVCREVD